MRAPDDFLDFEYLATLRNLQGRLAGQAGDSGKAASLLREGQAFLKRTRELAPAAERESWSSYFATQEIDFFIYLAQLAAREGDFTRARQAIVEAKHFSATERLGGEHLLRIQAAQASVELAAGNAGAALDLYRQSDQAFAKLGLAENNLRRQPLREGIQRALLQAGRLADAGGISTTGAGPNGDVAAQGLLLWQQGHTTAARALFEQATQEALARLGRSHVVTLRNQALVHLVQQTGTSESLRESHSRLSRMLATLRSADRTQTVGEHPYLMRMSEIFIAGVARQTAPDPAWLNLGFQLAEQLRGSSVEGAVLEAASRSAVRRAGLADMQAEQQRLRARINAGFDTLGRQLAAPASLRDETQIAQLREQLSTLQEERQALLIELERAHPAYARLTNPPLPQLADLRRYLRPGELLLSIQPMSNGTAVWAISRDAAPHFHLSRLTQSELGSAVARLRRNLDAAATAGLIPFDNATAELLHAELIAPLTATISAHRTLVVSAAGSLGQIPFALLRQDGAHPWLVQRIAVSHVPSVNALVAQRITTQAPATNASFIGFGDPQFSRGSAPRSTLAALRSTTGADPAKSQFTAEDYARVPPCPKPATNSSPSPARLAPTRNVICCWVPRHHARPCSQHHSKINRSSLSRPTASSPAICPASPSLRSHSPQQTRMATARC